ncbi:hypothetical protein ACLOJK_033548 [Asimina triloba]
MFSTQFVLSFALLLSLPLLFLLAPRILPPRSVPISLPDELDDLALFRRAALANLSPPPPPPTPKIAFLFLTNTDLYFAPLWERFFAGHDPLFNIYIHADPTARINAPTSGVFFNRFIVGKRTQRSSPTLISAARRLLAAALLDDPANAFFALLSQNCIPLHSFRFVYHALFASEPVANVSSSLNSTTAGLASMRMAARLTRYHYRSFIEILADEPNLWDRYTARGDDVMLPEVPFSEFRVGSQFFVLTRRHALLVIQDRRLWRKFRLPCLRAESCYPEEHYFPTLLSMEDPDGCSHYTLTRVNWTGSVGGHPHTYMPQEVSLELISQLRKSNSTYSYLFARKFAPACLEPLMKIANLIIFRD